MSKYEPMDFPIITKVDAVTSTHVYTDIIELPSTIKQKRWKPKNHERFYYIDIAFDKDIICMTTWCNSKIDNILFKLGNCFRTKKETVIQGKLIKRILKG